MHRSNLRWFGHQLRKQRECEWAVTMSRRRFAKMDVHVRPTVLLQRQDSDADNQQPTRVPSTPQSAKHRGAT